MSFIVLLSYFGLGILSFKRLYTSSKISLITVGGLILFSLVQFVLFLVTQFDQLNAFEKSRITQIMDLLGGKVNTETTTNRSDIAAAGLQWISEAPFLGWGFGSFHSIRYHGDIGIHNMFLMLMGESGIIPVLLLITFFLFSIYKSVKIENLEYRYLSLTFFLFTLFFANGNHNLFDNYEVGFLFGFICALVKIDNIEKYNALGEVE